MNFDFSDDAKALRDQARRFLDERAGPKVARAAMVSDAPYDTMLWNAIVELGWPAARVPEAHGGLGVAVLLRYTLRLLTIDQTERAAALICALELLRRSNPTLLGEQRFALGMWVGGTTTPNSMADAVKQIDEFRNSAGRNFPAPLVDCPWCGAAPA